MLFSSEPPMMRSVRALGRFGIADDAQYLDPAEYMFADITMHYNRRSPYALEISGHARRESRSFVLGVDREVFINCVRYGEDTFGGVVSIAQDGPNVTIIQQTSVMLSINIPLNRARRMAKIMTKMCFDPRIASDLVINRELKSLEAIS